MHSNSASKDALVTSTSVVDLKARLRKVLQREGVTGKVTAQLRSWILKRLSNESDVENVAKNKTQSPLIRFPTNRTFTLKQRALNFVIDEYLKFANFKYSRTVFKPEANLSDETFAREEVFDILSSAKDADSREDVTKPILLQLIDRAKVKRGRDLDSCRAVEESKRVLSLEKRLDNIDRSVFGEENRALRSDPPASASALVLVEEKQRWERECEQRYRRLLLQDRRSFRQSEALKIRAAERERVRNELSAARMRFESDWETRNRRLTDREETLEQRLNQRLRDLEEKEYHARQRILAEMERLRAREADLGRSSAAHRQAVLLERQRMKEARDQHKRLERARNEEEKVLVRLRERLNRESGELKQRQDALDARTSQDTAELLVEEKKRNEIASKQIAELERETNSLRKRCEAQDMQLREAVRAMGSTATSPRDDKTSSTNYTEKLKKDLETTEKLSETLRVKVVEKNERISELEMSLSERDKRLEIAEAGASRAMESFQDRERALHREIRSSREKAVALFAHKRALEANVQDAKINQRAYEDEIASLKMMLKRARQTVLAIGDDDGSGVGETWGGSLDADANVIWENSAPRLQRSSRRRHVVVDGRDGAAAPPPRPPSSSSSYAHYHTRRELSKSDHVGSDILSRKASPTLDTAKKGILNKVAESFESVRRRATFDADDEFYTLQRRDDPHDANGTKEDRETHATSRRQREGKVVSAMIVDGRPQNPGNLVTQAKIDKFFAPNRSKEGTARKEQDEKAHVETINRHVAGARRGASIEREREEEAEKIATEQREREEAAERVAIERREREKAEETRLKEEESIRVEHQRAARLVVISASNAASAFASNAEAAVAKLEEEGRRRRESEAILEAEKEKLRNVVGEKLCTENRTTDVGKDEEDKTPQVNAASGVFSKDPVLAMHQRRAREQFEERMRALKGSETDDDDDDTQSASATSSAYSEDFSIEGGGGSFDEEEKEEEDDDDDFFKTSL